jgi:hypothetical protein
LRRFISITLLLLFSFPLISPLFALGGDAESRLPACCRTHGKHHCMMSANEMELLLHGEHFTPVRSKCPLFPNPTIPVSHLNLFFQHPSLTIAENVTHPARRSHTEAWARVALEGARHKRGPPSISLS